KRSRYTNLLCMVLKQKFKLHYHSRNDSRSFVTEDVIISSRGGHNINIGDVIEVYHAEDAHHALFLVTTLSDDLQNRDVISIEQSLAHTFKLQQHKNVIVNVMNKEAVSLDLVELYFRDQYFSRRDFCNITQKLIGTVVHVNKKLTCNETRTQVGDLWRLGERYSCGYIDSTTKIIFRSSTAVIHIFIQMSQEMWWFDNNGDLYLEKAFKFLSKLFLKFWPENNCNHDTTVVFFTRIYIDNVPAEYAQSFKQDALNRYYEDFYRVIIQNERFTTDDWKRELGRMQYEVLQFENNIYSYLRTTYPLIMNNKDDKKIKLNICTAMDANLLEVLNMAINLYSGYNIDRNFDRTGKLLFVIAPGSGVYHVNENLLLLTKKRVLDLGVGVDLICLAEQPLHAVPLFKILSESFINPEEYIAPHWINCSYFKSAQELKYIEMGKPFPRVKVVTFKHSDDMFVSRCTNGVPGDNHQSDSQYISVSKETHDDTTTTATTNTTTTTTVIKSSLPIYCIAYPSYQSSFNENNNQRKKSYQPPSNENLVKSQNCLINSNTTTTTNNNNNSSSYSLLPITNQSSTSIVESNCYQYCSNDPTASIVNNPISAMSRRSKQTVSTTTTTSTTTTLSTATTIPSSPASSSSCKNLSRSYDSYITSNHPVAPHLHTLLSRVTSIDNATLSTNTTTCCSSSNSSSCCSSISHDFTTITSLPSIRKQSMENEKSQMLSIPRTCWNNVRNRTQSLNVDGADKQHRQHHQQQQQMKLLSINRHHHDKSSNNNMDNENVTPFCRTMDVILSDGQPLPNSWNIITPQHSILRNYHAIIDRRTHLNNLSGLNSQTLPFTRRKSTATLYATITPTTLTTTTTTTGTTTINNNLISTPIQHFGKYYNLTTTYSRQSTINYYATSSLVSGAYFPFGVNKHSYRMPISAGQRRWALVRPSDEYGGTITPHCIITSSDDIDFMYPAPLPYNLCQIWAAYFDFLRTRLLDKKQSNQHIVKHTTTNNNGDGNCVNPPILNTQMPSKRLSTYDEYNNDKGNISSNHSHSHQFNHQKSLSNFNTTSKMQQSTIMQQQNLSQLSETSMKALENLLEIIKHAISYSIQSSFSSSSASSSSVYLTSMPSLSSTFWQQNQNILNSTSVPLNTTTATASSSTTNSNNSSINSNNNLNNTNVNATNNISSSSDDQKLFSLQMNNFNKLTNYKQMIPKRVDALRNMLRLIGVDWKSLIVPACLPVDTDYFPDTCRLRSEWYTLHDYRVVPSGMSPDEWASMNNAALEPGALYNRRQLTAREVFQEMVLQRISQGFQLCHEVVVAHNPTNPNSNIEHHSVTSINASPATIIQNDNLVNCSNNINNNNITSSNNNKPKTLSLIKQTNERLNPMSNSPHATYNSRRLSNISHNIIDTTTITSSSNSSSITTPTASYNNHNIKNSSGYFPTNKNTTTTTANQYWKSTNRCLPTRLSSKFTTINNNVQSSRGSHVSSSTSACVCASTYAPAYNGRVLGVGLTINPSTRPGHPSNCINCSSSSGSGRGTTTSSNNSNSNNNNGHTNSSSSSSGNSSSSGGVSTTTTTTATNKSLINRYNTNNTNSMFNSSLSRFGDTDQLLKTTTTRKLSIGHLFHLISLDEDSIGVTSYREIDKLIKITYSYALQVPDAKSYVTYNTNFTSDSTVILNWNYLDNYLCNRGISDSFRLLPNLKFWRSRFFVIPIFSNETRRLAEAIRDNTTGQRIPCDVYELDYLNINREKTCEKFVHFIESINRIRRTLLTSRKLNRQSTIEKSDIHRSNTTTTMTATPTVVTSTTTTITNSNTTDTTINSCSKSKTNLLFPVTMHPRPLMMTSSFNNTTTNNHNNNGGSFINESMDFNVQSMNNKSSDGMNSLCTDHFYTTISLPNISSMNTTTMLEDQLANGLMMMHTNLFHSNTTNIHYYLISLMMIDNE
ncbi:unnamed protein product, partial [Schistosoma turkestanicum]